MRFAPPAARSARAVLVAAMIVMLSTMFAPPAARAQSNEITFKLGPGGTAMITFVAYCTDFGKFFPEQIQGPNGNVAADPIPAALAYISSLGIADDSAKALEANFAIWQLAGATRATGGGDLTKDVKANATTPPSAPAGAISILDAAKDGKATLTLDSWTPIGDKVKILNATDHFHGRGTLMVENTSTEVLTLYMPTGTLFPGVETRLQVMGAYAEDVQTIDARLPATGAGDELPTAALALVALALLAGGVSLRTATRQSTAA